VNALERLEAADPVDESVFEPPTLELDEDRAARPRRARRVALGLVAAVAAAAAVLLVPGAGDDRVIARTAAALGRGQVVYTEAWKIEFGRVVSREQSWTSSDGTRRRVLIHSPRGGIESEIVENPEGWSIFRPDAATVDVFEPGHAPREFEGDPVTLLARAREGRDGLRVVGEDHIHGQRVHLLEARAELGSVRIAVSAETFLPVSATLGLSTWEYARIEKLPHRDALLAPTLGATRATVCVHRFIAVPACIRRPWPSPSTRG
jgi:hypothetical protein